MSNVGISEIREEQLAWAFDNHAYSSLRTHREFWDFDNGNRDFVPAISIVQKFTASRGLCLFLSNIISPYELPPHLRPKDNEGQTIDDINERNRRRIIRRREKYLPPPMVAVFAIGDLSLRFCDAKGKGLPIADLVNISRFVESNNPKFPVFAQAFLKAVSSSSHEMGIPKWVQGIVNKELKSLSVL